MLGRNPADQVSLSGYAEHSVRNPQHRFWVLSLNDSYPAPPSAVAVTRPVPHSKLSMEPDSQA